MTEPYDFNKREDHDYSHSYDFLGGMGLGRSEMEAEIMLRDKLGTYDMQPVEPPENSSEEDQVIRLATLIKESKDRRSLLKRAEQCRDRRMEVLWNQDHRYHKYFQWALHCMDREVVNWRMIRAGHDKSMPDRKPKSEMITKPEAQLGDNVEIDNVKSRPELNGKIGKITSDTGDRWIVDFDDIQQSVSLSKQNCIHTNRSEIFPKNELPKGLKVEIRDLTSESGKLLNGQEGYIMQRKNDRYFIRLVDSNQLKAIKPENLHVVLPPGWDEKFDSSTGKKFFINPSGLTSWDHPILNTSSCKARSTDEFVNHHGDMGDKTDDPSDREDPGEFNRSQFLRDEAKRLKLDKKREFSTVDWKMVENHLSGLRDSFRVDKLEKPSFIGLPKDLLENLNTASSSEELTKWLVISFVLLAEDLRQLKFNKKQIAVLIEKIDSVIEEKTFNQDMIDWIIGGLKVAMPFSYTLH